MSYRQRVVIAAAIVGVALAGPSWAADPPKAGAPVTQVRPMGPCPAGWKLLPGGTEKDFLCAPPKPKVTCPPGSTPVVKDCNVGCQTVIK